MLVSIDDKAIIPVGEPHCHVSTSVCGHNRSLVLHSGAQLVALDHDFHVHGIVLSIYFFISIPESASDLFYRGDPFVTNKDKLYRHCTELTNIVTVDFLSLFLVITD